jgi:hypothetical protein
MTLITEAFSSIIGGVSQQAPSQRLSNQVEKQENCLNSITQGMRKRPNTVRVAELNTGSTSIEDAYIHQIKRDRFEQYVVSIQPSGITVNDRKTGFGYPVVYKSGETGVDPKSYLTLTGQSSSVREAYSAVTSADTTYVLNRTQPILRSTKEILTEDGYKREAIIIGSFNYSSGTAPKDKETGETIEKPPAHYRFKKNGTQFLSETEDVSPDEIAKATADYLKGLAEYSSYTFMLSGNIIYVDYPEASAPVEFEDDSYYFRNNNGITYTLTPYEIVSRRDANVAINLDGLPNTALCHIRQADYSVTYSINVNGQEATYVTPEPTTEGARAGLSLQMISSNLVSQFNNMTGISAVLGLGYFTVSTTDGTPIKVSCSDDLNGEAIEASHGTVQLFSDLPSRAPDGYLIKVIGSAQDSSNGYWVKFVQTGEVGSGYWEESRIPSEVHDLDADSMIHVLKRETSQSYVSSLNPLGIHFVFAPAEWDERKAGDNAATPFPSFCSEWDFTNNIPTKLRYINSMTFHKNRLVLSSDEEVVFSESGNYWNFFRTTAQTVKDSDPIDISIMSQTVNPIKEMVSAQKELILYGTRKQYSLRSGDIFSAASVWADPISSHDIDLAAKPQYVGSSVYFVVNREKYNGIFESIVNEGHHEAMDVTAHVPEYVEGRVIKLATSGSEDMLLALTRSEANTGSRVYQYSHKTQGREKVLSSWNVWQFAQSILDIEMEGSVAHIVSEKDGKFYSETLNLAEDTLRDELGVPVFLDMRQEVATTDATPSGMSDVVYKGRKFIGYPYTQYAELSQLFLRDRTNSAVHTGRVQARRLTLDFDETTSFDVVINQEGRESRTTSYEGRILGSITQKIGQIPVDNGTLKVPLFGRTKGMRIEIINDTPFDCRIQSGEWEGLYYNRARRI